MIGVHACSYWSILYHHVWLLSLGGMLVSEGTSRGMNLWERGWGEETGDSGVRGNYAQDVIYKRRIKK